MKRKYYLRGLGLGILVTALVCAFTGKKEMTEEEIIKRAVELGYTKPEDTQINIKELLDTPIPTNTQSPTMKPTVIPTETSAPKITSEPAATEAPTATAAPTATPTPTATAAPTATVAPTATAAPTATVAPTATAAPTATSTPTPTEVSGEATITVVIEKGNTATVVCKKIQEAGVISDANALREYLVKRQLTDFINVGTYKMTKNMSFEEIAKMITE